MAHAGKKLALGSVRSLRLLLGGLQLAFDAFAIGGVADCGYRQDAFVGLEWAEANLDRKLLPILAGAKQVEPGAHFTAAGIFEKVASIAGILAMKTFWDQNFDFFSEQFLALVAEDFFGLRIYQHDRAFAVDDDNGIGSGFEQRFEFLISLAALGNVLRRSNDSEDLAGIVDDSTSQAMQKPGLAVWQNNSALDSGGFMARH